ncbi:MAG: nitroreductase family protein [Peptococcaceae bacterium]|nr:nitroreductase family protein [Peptococcaceae bacterium]
MKRKLEADIMPEIKERHSTTVFSSEPVDAKDLEEILLAGTLAPSAYNGQPWRFYVVTEQAEKEWLAEYMLPAEKEWIFDAPVLILLAGYLEDEHNGLYNYWAMFDSGCAWGYMSLEAQRRGYVTHCVGSFDRVDLRSMFQLGEKLDLYGIIALGRPGKTEKALFEKSPQRKSVNAVMLRRKE